MGNRSPSQLPPTHHCPWENNAQLRTFPPALQRAIWDLEIDVSKHSEHSFFAHYDDGPKKIEIVRVALPQSLGIPLQGDAR